MTTTARPDDPDGPGALAAADLAERLGRHVEEVAVVSVQEVTWRDGALGCPQPGHVYSQALVDGHRILLDVDGQTYTYHSGGNTAPFLCRDPQSPT